MRTSAGRSLGHLCLSVASLIAFSSDLLFSFDFGLNSVPTLPMRPSLVRQGLLSLEDRRVRGVLTEDDSVYICYLYVISFGNFFEFESSEGFPRRPNCRGQKKKRKFNFSWISGSQSGGGVRPLKECNAIAGDA